MAEPSTFPGAPGEGEIFPRPFDRQALEATLADAVRDAEIAAETGGLESLDDPPAAESAEGPVAARRPAAPAVADDAGAPVAAETVTADEDPAVLEAAAAPLGVTPPAAPLAQAASRAARPPRKPASGAAPGPRRGPLPSGIIPAPLRPEPGPAEKVTPPRPRLIGSGLAGVGGSLRSGSGLHPAIGSSDAIGSGDPAPLGRTAPLGGGLVGQSVSRLSPAPINLAPRPRGLDNGAAEPADHGTDAAAIPFRRPKRPAPAPASSETDTATPEVTPETNREASRKAHPEAGQSGGQKTATAAPPRPAPPIVAWSPSDDDILPQGSARKRNWRRGR